MRAPYQLWQHAKMSTTLKTPDGLKDAECKKWQLSNRPPIPYIPVVDSVMPKEDSQAYKVKLPDDSHINMHIYSRGNNKEYLTHIVAVFHVTKQRGLDSRCRKLERAVLRQFKMLKILLEAAGSQDTVSMTLLTSRPAWWRLSRPNSCSKISRRLMMMQPPKSTSSCEISCPAIRRRCIFFLENTPFYVVVSVFFYARYFILYLA
jgi:hypothetical protein